MQYISPLHDLSDSLFFNGSDEATRHNKFLHVENELLADVTHRAVKLATEGARRHLYRGFLRRHLMMQTARVDVRERCKNQKQPLSPYDATHISIYINAYYLNLTGALDNLAWAISFEHGLRASLSEDDPKSRFLATITGREFRESLRASRPKAVEAIDTVEPWLQEIKRFRDPAAHRLPLTIVAGVMTEDEGEQFHVLKEKAKEAATAGDIDRYFELQREAHRLGSFLPLLEEPRGPKGEFHAVPNQVSFDQERYLWLSIRLIEACL